jgi:hypothetical protein
MGFGFFVMEYHSVHLTHQNYMYCPVQMQAGIILGSPQFGRDSLFKPPFGLNGRPPANANDKAETHPGALISTIRSSFQGGIH